MSLIRDFTKWIRDTHKLYRQMFQVIELEVFAYKASKKKKMDPYMRCTSGIKEVHNL